MGAADAAATQWVDAHSEPEENNGTKEKAPSLLPQIDRGSTYGSQLRQNVAREKAGEPPVHGCTEAKTKKPGRSTQKRKTGFAPAHGENGRSTVSIEDSGGCRSTAVDVLCLLAKSGCSGPTLPPVRALSPVDE